MGGRIAFVVADAPVPAALLRAAAELGLAADAIETVPPGLNPLASGYAAGQIAAALKAAGPDLVHCIGLRASLVGGAACLLAGIDRRVFGIGGAGDWLPHPRLAGRAARRGAAFLLGRVLRSPRTRYLFGTEGGARALRFDPRDGAVAIIRLSGVDAEGLRPPPMPAAPPLRVAVAGPLLRAMAVDVAVEAVRIAREGGLDVELTLVGGEAGAPPQALRPETLRGWAAQPGIRWQPVAPEPATLWAEHHLACMPSRAGEGVPDMLLEAAACGRPLVATDIPGRRDFITDDQEGLLVAPDDPAALAAAFRRFAEDPVLLPRMGAASRARVLHGWTERDAAERAKALYRAMLAGAPA
ncbi:glycosyltransferase [Enterovirga aerilata]|uniref:Glycosyltransferase n=1 Tax=Enterovirga aerilata TaxID=2730920 RepID=A0A849I2G2_9HYPH|nr:glycosyltransferase [Enterovirga sp. DB1703]NNM71551.1 glycosyltransferase [Enterovirga sp. DB1703]